MKKYYQNGTSSDVEFMLSDEDEFTIYVMEDRYRTLYYSNDHLIREIDEELIDLYDKFRDLYFSNLDLYYQEVPNIPIGLGIGGLSSSVAISKNEYLNLNNEVMPQLPNLARHLHLGDCQYLISTVQNLLRAIEYCYVQYFIQISQIELPSDLLSENTIIESSSERSFQLMFFVETFFTKMYSVLDMMVKIVYELENPTIDVSGITKLKSSQKLWGDRKYISVSKTPNTIFEDCEVLRQIESLRNETVHNATWEFNPRVFIKVNNQKIIKRYMMSPDFEDGRLATVKNRKHFFSTDVTANDLLVTIHDEFYHRLLVTLKLINKKRYGQPTQEVK